MEEIVIEAGKCLGFTDLKPKQKEAILEFISGNDVFVVLPTGYGKSVCYATLPLIFNQLRAKAESVVVVVSPLIALMKDQVKNFVSKGLQAAVVGCRDEQGILDGKYQLVYISPEALFQKRVWREMLLSDVYQNNLVGFIIDEAHCVKKWGDEFRREFSFLGDVRSLLPKETNIMCLTATATRTLQQSVISTVCMENPVIVQLPPDKRNLIFSVLPSSPILEDNFKTLLLELLEKHTETKRTIVFCQTQEQCARLYIYFKHNMGNAFTEPIGAPGNLSKFRMIDMYTSCTHHSVKDSILKRFPLMGSSLRVIISTVAFGMGVDCQDIRRIIHVGPPNDIEMYVQQTGRGGRDGEKSYCILLYGPGMKRYCEKSMIDYCENNSSCRRDTLYSDFELYKHDKSLTGCCCCDVCAKKCECSKCKI